jgi:hypothetical protein
MKTFTKEQLQEILQKHQLWLDGKEGGERAHLSSADLRYADLHSANLSSADLSSADLRSADLSSANLRSADLRYADLRYADLRSADLSFADLSSTDLSSANLLAIGNMVNVKSVQADIWPVAYTHDTLQIGCQRHLITEWWAFEDKEIECMDSRALAWWAVWKPILQAMIAGSPAEPTGFVESKDSNQ